ncbi:MAG: oligosaccharide flippase family protein [Candidatus Hodarchaeota archaeon]
MQKQQILINASMSVAQIVIISGILFVLYRFLLNTIGVEQLGIWSLVLATTSITQIANFGLSGSVVKFVAKYIARRENEKISGVIQTAAISVSIFVGFILLIGYPIAKWILGLVIPLAFIPVAHAILPYAFFALWIVAITGIFQAGLDGYQRIDIRCILLIGAAGFHLLLCFILAPTYGLMGLAYARVFQSIIIFISSWIFLKRYFPLLPILPYKWDKGLFKEMIGYGINFQIITVASMFYDPITKALLSKFGGLSMVGYFEMASKMVQQLRALIISANQVLVPAIANLQEKIPEKVQSVYLTSYRLLFYLSFPLYSLIIIFTPLISELWIGRYEKIFVNFGILLAIGWLLNTLAGPAYFAYLGIGNLRWNVAAHLSIATLNAGLGVLLGLFYDGIGVVVAWVVGLTLGSSIIYLSYHIRHKIRLIELLPKASRIIIIACLISILSALIIHHNLNNSLNLIVLNSLILISFLIIVFIPFWLHPMRKNLIRWINYELLKRPQS